MPDAVAGTEQLHLKDEFPAVSTAEWEAVIAADLKGADYEKRLVWKTDEGIAVKPYYRSEHLPADMASRRESAGWEMSEGAVPEGTVDAARWHEQGATSVQELAFAHGRGVRRDGGRQSTCRRCCLEWARTTSSKSPSCVPRECCSRNLAKAYGKAPRRDDLRAHGDGQQKPLRSLHQPAAGHDGGPECGVGRLRLAHRAAGPVQPEAGTERPADSERGIACGRGGRPGGRVVLRRSANGCAGGGGLEAVPAN